jgi:dTDP-4-dehydrorhamnose reductase
MASLIAEMTSGTGSVTDTTLADWEPIQSARCQAVGRQLAKRPVYSVLNTDKYNQFARLEPATWQDAIRIYFRPSIA